MSRRRFIVLSVLLAALLIGWFGWRGVSSRRAHVETSRPVIDKQPATYANRTFDPGNPPEDMPPLASGENAACDSNFLSSASVGGEAQQTDATHAIVTITRIRVTLRLNITTWLPAEPSQHVIEHEDGHRQISEYYYRTADHLAERIAATYMAKQFAISGTDLNAELSRLLQQTGANISDEYNKALNPEPAQLRYDAITDHSRNEVSASEAVAQALKDVNALSTAGWSPFLSKEF